MEVNEKIGKFITDNKLDFSGTGSGLNGNCVILAGFALFCGLEHHELCDIIDELEESSIIDMSSDAWDELERVFQYAEEKNYGLWWNSEDAKKQYIF